VEGCDDRNNCLGHTPISILLMFRKPNVNLLLYFLKIHPKAFANDVCINKPFTAVSNNPEITTLANLRFIDRLLLQKVMSFL
jgi:hypothetical protein